MCQNCVAVTSVSVSNSSSTPLKKPRAKEKPCPSKKGRGDVQTLAHPVSSPLIPPENARLDSMRGWNRVTLQGAGGL